MTNNERKIKRLSLALEFYEYRYRLLQQEQHKMRDPERAIVCDILAYGQLFLDPNDTRYEQPSDKDATAILRTTLEEIRDRIKAHPAYVELTESEELEEGGDEAEFSYLVRLANDALERHNNK